MAKDKDDDRKVVHVETSHQAPAVSWLAASVTLYDWLRMGLATLPVVSPCPSSFLDQTRRPQVGVAQGIIAPIWTHPGRTRG